MSLATYLSNYVHRILVEFSETSESSQRKYINKDLTYNWNEIEVVFGEIKDGFDILDQSDDWYLEKSELVWNVIHAAGSALSAVPDEERQAVYQLCDWVEFQYDVLQYAFENEQEDGNVLAVLVMTAALERSLGNVYMTKRCPVPFLLRDLLKTPELSSIFGKVPIVFTQLLVGCPKGFNLRNVTWHGFISPGELHPHLLPGFVVLFASLGKLLQNNEVIKKRPQFSSFENFEELNDVFPDIMDRPDEVNDMIEISPFIPEKNKLFWKKAYYLLLSGRHGYSLTLLMPQLEHCLRTIYCKVNNCPARLLTAESNVLYTTLDEILAPSQRAVVSDGLLMILLDVTSSMTGPRLRDRLSHGEIQLDSVPRWIVNFVFCVALATAHNFSLEDYKHGDKHCNITLCSQLLDASSRYQSKFHVVANLRRQLISLLDQWPCWQNCPQPTDVDLQLASCQQIKALDQMMFPCTYDVIEKLSQVKEFLEENELRTLYRSKPELELASALVVVVSGVTRTAEKVCYAAMTRHQLWCERGLRSRARTTAVRMWNVLPNIWTALLCIVMIVTLCYRQLPHLATQRKQIFRLVKMTTKAVENTVTLCDVEKTRWTEAHQILSNLAVACLQFFTNNSDLLIKLSL